MNAPLATIDAVSIILPTYNEAGHISELIHTTGAVMRDAGCVHVEIIVVDDDSPDETWNVAMGVKCPGAVVRVIRRTQNRGLTASLAAGIQAATHDVIVWLDSDFSHPPACIPQLLALIHEGYDVVVNSRYVAGGSEERVGKGSVLHVWLSRVLNMTARLILTRTITDFTSGFVAARREVLQAVPLRGDYGEYFLDFMYRVLRKKYPVCELPYTAGPRRSGVSKTGASFGEYWQRGRKYIAMALRLRWETLTGRI